jgi:hypothetical protein
MDASTFINGCYEGPIMVQDHLKKNDSVNGWISQKYGGTSIGKFPVQIAEIVRYGKAIPT